LIRYGKHYIDLNDKKELIKSISSDWITQGPLINKFERKLNLFFGSNYCTVLSSGTAALHIAMLSFVKKNDIILTTPNSFIATANCIVYANGIPDFVDINELNYTIDVAKLEDKIKFYKKNGKKISAVISTDYAGHPSDWKELRYLANKYNFKLINDNCHSLGSKYLNNEKYAIKYADIVTQSFHAVKNITTGEGGAIITNNKKLDNLFKKLRTHGVVKDNKLFEKKSHGPWYYEMNQLGYNYRITDFQCALGISQLKKIKKIIKYKNKIAEIYNKLFDNDKNFIVPNVKNKCYHSYHLYPLQINFDNRKKSKKNLFNFLDSKKIKLQVHYIPIHLQPYYRKKYKFKNNDFPIAEKFYKREISLPIYYNLKFKDVYNVAKSIKLFINK
tara:strand:- start:3 stop:1166 length:1164 start_codon:yes stop_codon:yes gene_type:complete